MNGSILNLTVRSSSGMLELLQFLSFNLNAEKSRKWRKVIVRQVLNGEISIFKITINMFLRRCEFCFKEKYISICYVT